MLSPVWVGVTIDPENPCPVASASVLALCLRAAGSWGPRGRRTLPPDDNRDRPVRQRFDDVPGFKACEALHGGAGQVQDFISWLDRLALLRGRPWDEGEEESDPQVAGGHGKGPAHRSGGSSRMSHVPLKMRLTVRGLSPCREPFPPSRLKPSPAEVFSSVTVKTAASAAEENTGCRLGTLSSPGHGHPGRQACVAGAANPGTCAHRHASGSTQGRPRVLRVAGDRAPHGPGPVGLCPTGRTYWSLWRHHWPQRRTPRSPGSSGRAWPPVAASS